MSEPGEELLLHEPKANAKEENIAALIRKMISLIGEDPNREGLRKTPERFEKALQISDQRLSPERGAHPEWRDLQRSLRSDGHCEGH